jgi:hypothetical protein
MSGGIVTVAQPGTVSRPEAYRRAMDDGYQHMRDRQWGRAYACFTRAHDLGHAVRSLHLAAHRVALACAQRSRRPDRIAYQAFFLGFAALTSW